MDVTYSGRSTDSLAVRALRESDFHLGFLECMSGLSEVGDVNEAKFCEQLAFREKQGTITMVVEDMEKKKIVATGTILFDYKFTRSCGLCAHIEDIVVDKNYRGQRLGHRIVDALVEEAHNRQCYKIILDCTNENKPFYEKLGFREKEVQMRYDITMSGEDYKKNSQFAK
eukprot:TRINITY_DN19237_c0_g1_i1.p1 TRINITY_DN19237_c0_g1~~TRINITY_DN19237_c0_g1_i1.p1  ORF type:complete len:170 (+),score=35.15 TRINITY_DN19237_c0_g1_i1:51-560(+)